MQALNNSAYGACTADKRQLDIRYLLYVLDFFFFYMFQNKHAHAGTK